MRTFCVILALIGTMISLGGLFAGFSVFHSVFYLGVLAGSLYLMHGSIFAPKHELYYRY